MSKLRVELNSAGVRELLRSPELRALVEKHARAARQRAGDGYEVYTAQTRVVALVGTATRSRRSHVEVLAEMLEEFQKE